MSTTQTQRYGRVSIERDAQGKPRAQLMTYTHSGQTRISELDSIELARLIAEASAAQLIITRER